MIEKKFIYEEDLVTLILEDGRDSYIYEDALGKIGSINFAKGYAQIMVDLCTEFKGYEKRVEILEQEFINLFGELPKYKKMEASYYYDTIVSKIKNNELKGYSRLIPPTGVKEYYQENISSNTKKRIRRK